MKTNLPAFLLGLALTGSGVADDAVIKNPADDNSYYVPETVSLEAASFIIQFKKSWRERQWPELDEADAWAKRQSEYEQAALPNVEKLITRFEPEIVVREINGVPVLDIKPKGWTDSDDVVIYLHGGAYTLFSARSSLNNILPLADVSKFRFISVDYTTAPVSRWKQTGDDVLAVIRGAYDKHGHKNVAIMGDSAGGGLAAGMIHQLEDKQMPMPAGLLLWSPWSDITNAGDTAYTLRNAELHYTYPALLKHSADAYADPKDQKHPYVSPVYGDFKSTFPPTLIQGGTKELFLSHFVRLYQKIDLAVEHQAKLDLYEGMWHVFQGNHELPESQVAIQKSARFLKQVLN